MRYRHLVDIQAPGEVRSATGAVSHTWQTVHQAVPATITSTGLQETRAAEMAVEEARYDIVLAGRYDGITSAMAVLDADGRRYDIDFVDRGLTVRQTRLRARLVAVPA